MSSNDGTGLFVILMMLVLIFGAFIGVAAYMDLKETDKLLGQRIDMVCEQCAQRHKGF